MEIVEKFANMAATLSRDAFEMVRSHVIRLVSFQPWNLYWVVKTHASLWRLLCKVSSDKLFASHQANFNHRANLCLFVDSTPLFHQSVFLKHSPMRNYKFIGDEWHLSHTESHACLHDISFGRGEIINTQRVIWVNNSEIELHASDVRADPFRPLFRKWRSLQLF
jgi:hypothetical protein